MSAALGVALVLVAAPLVYAAALTILLRERPEASLAEAAEALATAMRRWWPLGRRSRPKTRGKG